MHKPGQPGPSQQPLPPPQIVLSTAPDVSGPLTPTGAAARKSAKRASQTVMHQGFLLKLENPVQQHAQGKAYKAVLVGSKLQFYKPPGGGGAELREMFPDGLVQADIEEQVEAEAAAEFGGGAGGKSPVRRKFWGRSRHPELLVQADGDVHGTLDALVHEVVFGTTSESSSSERESFAQCVLLCLPSAVTARGEFDEAFVRYLGRALSAGGGDDRERETEREWVEWCVGTYALMHGGPGSEVWQEWMEKAGLNLGACVGRARVGAGPVAGTCGGIGPGIGSPYTGVFSPRPGHGAAFESVPTSLETPPPKSASLAQHLNTLTPAPGVAIPVNALTAETLSDFFARPSKLGATLERDRLGRDIFLRIPSNTIAKSLRVLNQAFLVLAVASVASGGGRAGSAPVEGILHPERFMHLPRGTDAASLFCGSDDAPHWLTRLVMTQVLSPDMVGHELPASDTAASVHGTVIPEGVKVSRTHTRAAVLCKWIRLGACLFLVLNWVGGY